MLRPNRVPLVIAGYAIREPFGAKRDRYEPILAVAVIESVEVVELEVPRIITRTFQPVITDSIPAIYGVNDGSPRQRMRHEARYSGERCRVHPYQHITKD